MRTRRIAAVTAVAIIAIAVSLSSTANRAEATPAAHMSLTCGAYPGALSPCFSDNTGYDYCTPYPWSPEIGHRLIEAMNGIDSASVIAATLSSTCGPDTDLGGHLNNVGGEFVLANSTLGMYVCTKRLASRPTTNCNQASLIFNHTSPWLGQAPHYAAGISKPSWTVDQMRNARRTVLCHEAGHGLGLKHNAGLGGCMDSLSIPPTTPTGIGAHAALDIKAAYAP